VFDFGEIDFIVAPALTSSPTIQASVGDETVLLETIPEIITIDIAAAGEQNEAFVIQ
jgi:hypothetical protein